MKESANKTTYFIGRPLFMAWMIRTDDSNLGSLCGVDDGLACIVDDTLNEPSLQNSV